VDAFSEDFEITSEFIRQNNVIYRNEKDLFNASSIFQTARDQNNAIIALNNRIITTKNNDLSYRAVKSHSNNDTASVSKCSNYNMSQKLNTV